MAVDLLAPGGPTRAMTEILVWWSDAATAGGEVGTDMSA